MMVDDYSWIDTWGMDSSDAGYYQDLIDFGVYNPAWYDSSAADGISGTDSSGFWSKLATALGNTTGSLASGLTGAIKEGGLDTLAGMLGMGYGLKNQYDWQELLSQGRTLAEKTGTLVSGWTPYTNQTVNMSEAQKQALGYAPNMLNQGQQGMIGSMTYDPSKVQSYVNPYVEGGLSAANRLTSQNLTENVLPTINSTFTGQGQFGSTRNAEFQNRAIRDTQQSIADANAKAMVGAYGQADTAYRDMLGQQGSMGQNLFTQGLQLGNLPVEQYQKMFSSPLSMFNTWSQGVGNFNPAGATGTGNTGIDFSKLLGG
jgi:hypothetical protein